MHHRRKNPARGQKCYGSWRVGFVKLDHGSSLVTIVPKTQISKSAQQYRACVHRNGHVLDLGPSVTANCFEIQDEILEINHSLFGTFEIFVAAALNPDIFHQMVKGHYKPPHLGIENPSS